MTQRNLFPVLLLMCAGTAHAQDVALAGPSGAAATMTAEHLQSLPAAEATVTSGDPPVQHRFQGPLLWTVLTDGHLIDPARHGDAVRQTLRIQGSDGYVAIIAMGELSPEFEDKPAVLALSMDDQTLARPRAVIPGDHRGGRGVHDVVRLTVDELPKRK